MSWIDQRPDDAMAGAFEAIGPEPLNSVEAAAFREAMSRLGAAVHVVTSAGPAGQTGFTATAVASVSDQPPTLLVCLNRRSVSAPVLSANGVFCVNTLRAGRGDDRRPVRRAQRQPRAAFRGRRLDHARDRLAGARSAVVAFDCRVSDVKAVGSHNVIFGGGRGGSPRARGAGAASTMSAPTSGCRAVSRRRITGGQRFR